MTYHNRQKSSDADIHVLHDQVGRAIVDKATAHVGVGEEGTELAGKTLLAVVLEDHILISLDDREALIENVVTVLLTHERLELREFARGNIDHLVLAHVSSHTSILALSSCLSA